MFNQRISRFIFGLLALNHTVYAVPPDPPRLTLSQERITQTASWTSVEGAKGYRLFYAPYPSANSIDNLDMGAKTNMSVELWHDATFYVAIQSYNNDGNSGYSNIESFTIECPHKDNKCERLKNLVTAWASEATIPSVLLRVEDSHGVIYFGAAGQSTFHASQIVIANSHFRSASVGKLFTAVAVLRGLGPFIGKTENGDEYFYHPGHWGVMLFVVPSKNFDD